jgi:DNA modification methylase
MEATLTTIAPFYQDAHCTIYNADCRKVLPFLERFGLLLTDPPYGIGDRMQGGTWGAADKYADFRAWDSAPKEYVMGQMVDCADTAIVWGGNYFQLPPARGWLVWRKINAVPTMAGAELAWTNIDIPCKAIDLPVGKHNCGHPTEKPLGLMQWCLGWAKDAATILDPFMGSGTTLVAAKLEGRTAVGIEVNEQYCELAAERLRQGVLF